jgi:cobyric acid synthase
VRNDQRRRQELLATALARWYSRQGFKVAPFKAQNMSNNARVAAGGEMGSAQYFQALAARCVPEVRMNPILLKPESETTQSGHPARAAARRIVRHGMARARRAPVADGPRLPR